VNVAIEIPGCIAKLDYRQGYYAGKTDPPQVTDGLNPKSKALPLRFSFPLAKLQSRRYTCQVSVLDPKTQKFAFWRAPGRPAPLTGRPFVAQTPVSAAT
jgi:hypothetical protein